MQLPVAADCSSVLQRDLQEGLGRACCWRLVGCWAHLPWQERVEGLRKSLQHGSCRSCAVINFGCGRCAVTCVGLTSGLKHACKRTKVGLKVFHLGRCAGTVQGVRWHTFGLGHGCGFRRVGHAAPVTFLARKLHLACWWWTVNLFGTGLLCDVSRHFSVT